MNRLALPLAFEAGAEQMTDESVDHLDEAIRACETVDDWVAGGRMFKDAVGFRVMELVYARCSEVQELQSTALCLETEADWSATD